MPPPPERRSDARVKAKVPVELHLEGNPAPFRTATSDLSLHGCYIETMFPFAVGAELEIKIQLNGTLLVFGTVATKDPQVGNGIRFTKILDEDVEELKAFLENLEKESEEKDQTEKGEKSPAEKDQAEKGEAENDQAKGS